MSRLNILMAATEMAPFAKTGALADSLLSLPAHLQQRGHQLSVVLPLYRSVQESIGGELSDTGVAFSVALGPGAHDCRVFEWRAENGVQVFLVRRDEFFDRSGIYGSNGRDYQDNSARFLFFAKCVVELARRLDPTPDLLHGHDWPCGMLPVFSKFRNLPFPQVLTVHDLACQGNFWSFDFGLANLPPDYFSPGGVEFFGSFNFLKSGMLFADRVVFPSDMFVSESRQSGYGCGMESLIRELQAKIVGIPEGVDANLWNPATDPALPAQFSAADPGPKRRCRASLLERLALDSNPRGPVLAMVTRLLRDKGFDILLPALDRILADDCRLVVLGRGEPEYESALKIAARRHAGDFAYCCEVDDGLARAIYAGADALLAPARIEPSGVRVMQALRYGAIPIVRASGGLRQIVEDFDPATGAGNGFVFYQFNADALVDCVRRAGAAFRNPAVWNRLLERAMCRDFSWDAAAERHERLYRELLAQPQPTAS